MHYRHGIRYALVIPNGYRQERQMLLAWVSPKLTTKQEIRIIIVDDDEAVCNALSRLIRSHAMQAKTFSSSEDFISQVQSKSGIAADCIILDQQMPGLTGLQVQAALRQLKIQLPIVFISALEDPSTEQKALAGGALAFLHKPFRDQDLIRVLKTVINLH
jgi:FixJ family two-component response regulator